MKTMSADEMRFTKACRLADKMHYKTGLTYCVIERMWCASNYDIITWDKLGDDQNYLYSVPDHEHCPA